MTQPLVLVSGHTVPFDQYRREVSAGSIPRIDYMEIAERLGGAVYGYDRYRGSRYAGLLGVEKRLKLDIGTAFSAAARSSNYNLFLSTSEKAAIPLSMFLTLARRVRQHVLIGHHLSSGNKRRLFRLWKLDRTLSSLICVSRAQANFAVDQLHFPASKVNFVFDKVDHRFFSPAVEEPEDFILAVGQEQRDYETLLNAISGTGLKLVVVASSPWSTFSVKLNIPETVTVLSRIPFIQLRDLYACAKLVVVPLFDADYAAGANAVLEGMSMGKPVVLSRTIGISDYIVDQETGRYATPVCCQELRDTILALWNSPAERKRLGANARQAVEETMSLDHYASRVVRIIENTSSQ